MCVCVCECVSMGVDRAGFNAIQSYPQASIYRSFNEFFTCDNINFFYFKKRRN